MAEESQDKNGISGPQAPGQSGAEELGAAGKYLSEALRISFGILKVIMFILVLIFLGSGFRTVESGEEALVLRFGKIVGTGDERVLGPGFKWLLPYPIDKIVKIPVGQKVNLAINSFWYFQSKRELLSGEDGRVRPGSPLRPILDGYCLTRGERGPAAVGGEGSDYGIVHCKWELTYRIEDPEAFYCNVYVKSPRPGQDFSDVIAASVNPLLESVVEDAVVTSLVHFTIDEVKFERVASVTNRVRQFVQAKLDAIGAGIAVVSLQLTRSTWPRQVDLAFQAYISASQASQQQISEARTHSEQVLNEAAGPVAEELFGVIKDGSVGQEERELLWSQAAGAARERIADARAYRTEVVERVKAQAEYLHEILPEYRERPELVLQQIYVEAMERIFVNADEKFLLQPAEGVMKHEIRILLNRDPSLKPKVGEADKAQE
jgi:membrane protease subunit HflK